MIFDSLNNANTNKLCKSLLNDKEKDPKDDFKRKFETGTEKSIFTNFTELSKDGKEEEHMLDLF